MSHSHTAGRSPGEGLPRRSSGPGRMRAPPHDGAGRGRSAGSNAVMSPALQSPPGASRGPATWEPQAMGLQRSGTWRSCLGPSSASGMKVEVHLGGQGKQSPAQGLGMLHRREGNPMPPHL